MSEIIIRESFKRLRKAKVGKHIEGTPWTYVIYDTETNYTKIGVSKNPNERLSQIRVSRPNAFMFALHTQNIEKDLHEEYKTQRKYGEWFDLSEDELTDLICEWGFRYAPNLFLDDFGRYSLYNVQNNELPTKYKHELNFSNKSFRALYEFCLTEREKDKRISKKELIRRANDIGLRSPLGEVWEYQYALRILREMDSRKNITL